MSHRLILKVLSDHGPMTVRQVAARLGITHQLARYHVTRLEYSRAVAHVGFGERDTASGRYPKMYAIKGIDKHQTKQ